MKRNSRDNRNDLSGSQLDDNSTQQMRRSKINRLQETGLFYKKKIHQESSKLHQIEQDIKLSQQELDDLRGQLRDKRKYKSKWKDGELNVKYEHQRYDKLEKLEKYGLYQQDQCDPVVLAQKINIMKAKVNTEKTKLNEQVAKNKALKTEIDRLREEKYICDDIHHKLEVDLAIRKGKLKEAKDERDKIKDAKFESKMAIEKSKKERSHQKKEFEKQFHSVFQILNEENRDQRLHEAGLKEKKRDGNQSDADNIFDDFEASPNAGTSQFDESPGRKKQREKNRVKNTEVSEQDLKKKKKQVEEYQLIFDSLKKETNSYNIDEIVKKFVDYQDENYALFNYINTIRDEYEVLNKEKIMLQKQLNQLEKEQKSPNNENDPKTKKFNELTHDIMAVRKRRSKDEQDYQKLKQIINELKISVPIMFDRIGCNSEEYTRELDSINAKDIQESNMLQILAVIEKRTNDLLQLYSVAYKHGNPNNQKGLNEDSNQSFSNYGVKYDKKVDEVLPENVRKGLNFAYDDAIDKIKKVKDEGEDKQKQNYQQTEDIKKSPAEAVMSIGEIKQEIIKQSEDVVFSKKAKVGQQNKKGETKK